jgi:hypothetical protein
MALCESSVFIAGAASMAQPQTLNERLIAREVLIAKILEKLAPLSYHYEKPPAGMEILLVDLHVIRELPYPGRQYRDLNFRRARVRAVRLVLLDYLLL